MFARRRSLSSLDKLPCLNIAFLACYLLLIGHVSSMSLDRTRRQYQQQNDKQLELSELMLPEAESEMLQNDMELVSADGGNSDMYLLVPASAVSQQQNLQTLTDLNDSQNSGNVESDSDMLMQESEDTPAVQILALPESEGISQIRDELVANNELDQEAHSHNENEEEALNNAVQVSGSTLNNIAAAAQEIENKLVDSELNTEIEESIKADKAKQTEISTSGNELVIDDEAENADVGGQKEKSSKQSAQVPHEIEKVYEDMQSDFQSADSEMQPAATELTQQSLEKMGKDTDSNESFPAMELIKTVDEANIASETKQTSEESQISRDGEPIKNAELETAIEIKNKIIDENLENHSEDETRQDIDLQSIKEISGENSETEKDQVDKESQAVKESVEEQQIDEEIKTLPEEQPVAGEETEVEIVPSQADETKDEINRADEGQAVAETQPEDIQEENKPTSDETQSEIKETNDEVQTIPIDIPAAEDGSHSVSEGELLKESAENEKVENIQPSEESSQDSSSDENQPATQNQLDHEMQIVGASVVSTSDEEDHKDQLSLQSQIIEEIKKQIKNEESQISELNREHDLQASNGEYISQDEKHEKIEQLQNEEEIQYIENQNENVAESQIVHEEAELGAESSTILKEETQQQTELNKDSQDVEISQLIELNQSPEQIETAKAPKPVEHGKIEEVLPIMNALSEEEVHHEEQTGTAEEAHSAVYIQSEENIKSTEEESQSDELSHSGANVQNLELSKPVDVDLSQPIKDAPDETNHNNPTESSQAVVDQVEIENNPIEEYQTDSEVPVENVKPVVPDAEIQPLYEENESFDTQPSTPALYMQQSDETNPLDISSDTVIAEESVDQTNILDSESILQYLAPIDGNQNDQEQDSNAEIQVPLEDTESVLSNDNKDSEEPNKEVASLLTGIVPTNEELTQQQHEEHQEIEQLEEHRPAVLQSPSKPVALDGVQNYVNVSYTNQMSNNENSNNENTKQEVKKEEEQLFSSKLRRYDGAQVWRIVVQNDRERKFADELQTKYDGQLWKEVKQEVDYLLKPQVLADAEKYVRAANLTRIVLIDNLQAVIEVENPPAEEIAQLQNRKGYRLTWQAYHRLEDIHGYFDYLAKTYPDICSVEIIGYSLEKRPLKILKISNGNANNTGIWIDGGMHAREWISPAVATYVASHIAEGWDDLPVYMRNINWYIHAVANPDGYEYSHTTDRLWRKNMRSHGRACPGVDLNRNFGYKWGGKGTSANPCSQTYRGSKAFSEPETFYISKFISNFPRETFKGYLSFHSYGQYILYPWGYDYHITKDMADLDLVARQAGTIITKSTGSKFTVGSSATTLYPAAGGSDDWAKGIAGIKYSYTIEMGDTGRYGFVLPAEYIEPNGRNGLTFVQTVAKAITLGKNSRRRKLKAYRNH